ncbi:MAG: hypothetical protein ACNYVW_00440 [Methanosarcinales archaeon]
MGTQVVKVANGSAKIAHGEILELRGEWTSTELASLLLQLNSMEDC